MGRNKGLFLEKNLVMGMINRTDHHHVLSDLPPLVQKRSLKPKSNFMIIRRSVSPQVKNFKKQMTKSRNKILEEKDKKVRLTNITN
jgi:hypothetical protein